MVDKWLSPCGIKGVAGDNYLMLNQESIADDIDCSTCLMSEYCLLIEQYKSLFNRYLKKRGVNMKRQKETNKDETLEIKIRHLYSLVILEINALRDSEDTQILDTAYQDCCKYLDMLKRTKTKMIIAKRLEEED